MTRRILLLAVFCCALMGAAPASFQDIEESLTCQCGCGLTVHSCNHLQCGSALPLRDEIRDQMQQGKDKDGILTYFSGKYGEKILSSPTMVGLNVVAWVMPFVLVAVGGIFVVMTVMRWTGRKRAAPPGGTASSTHVQTPYDKIMEKELKNFEV